MCTLANTRNQAVRAVTFAALFLFLRPSIEARPPNVIVIYTDDQGSVDMNAYGSKDLETPHMDSLARRGVRFTQFYAPAPVCSASRAGLLTGRFPIRAGMPMNAGSTKGKGGMPPSEVTLAETLGSVGYATAHVGKWHLGYKPETMPNGQGFDYSFGHMGGCIDNWSHFFYWQGPNRHDLWRQGEEVFEDGRYFPTLMVEEASQFIEKNRERPFFIYFALNVPHYPYQGHPKWLGRYKDLPYPRNLYAAFLSTIDEHIGELVAKVDALGLRKDTIIVFQSDHGHSHEERAHRGGGSAGPYRGAKFSLFEGGIRVPAVISWPGHLPEGRVIDEVAHGCDWLPTIAEFCEAPLLQEDIDGSSLAPLLRGQTTTSPHDVLHWTFAKSWAVREGPWKLLGSPKDTSGKLTVPPEEKRFLANLDKDVTEMKNLAAAHPEIVERLEKLHQDWWQGIGK